MDFSDVNPSEEAEGQRLLLTAFETAPVGDGLAGRAAFGGELLRSVRQRSRRARRMRALVPAGALLAAGGAGALAVTMTASVTTAPVPALTSAAPAGGTELTAWTVARQPDGAINVTIRELQDLPALQAKLTDDGARVAVGSASTATDAGPTSVTPPAGCQVGPTNPAPLPAAVIFQSTQKGYQFTIQPTKIPADDMVRIAITTGGAGGLPGSPALPGIFALLVHDSPGCGF